MTMTIETKEKMRRKNCRVAHKLFRMHNIHVFADNSINSPSNNFKHFEISFVSLERICNHSHLVPWCWCDREINKTSSTGEQISRELVSMPKRVTKISMFFLAFFLFRLFFRLRDHSWGNRRNGMSIEWMASALWQGLFISFVYWTWTVGMTRWGLARRAREADRRAQGRQQPKAVLILIRKTKPENPRKSKRNQTLENLRNDSTTASTHPANGSNIACARPRHSVSGKNVRIK